MCLALVIYGLLASPYSASQDENTDGTTDAVDDRPSAAELEASGAVIGRIDLDKQNVFNLSDPQENNALYRLANRWHIITRDRIIMQQLLFREGDEFSERLLEESERLLRQNNYFYDAKITPIRYEDGVVDIRVWTRDLWTLVPGFSLSRSGGENRTRIELSETNLVGLGAKLRAAYVENVDRDSLSLLYYDKNLGKSWTTLLIEHTDSSDGDTARVDLVRPFYALDTRWSAGATIYNDERETSFYDLGREVAEYKSETRTHSAFWGWSAGLEDGWVRRWTTGVVYDDRDFSPVAMGTLPALVPADRKLVYPFLGFELLEDDFETASNRDQFERTEDFFMGRKLGATLGWASEGFGSDRDALLYSLNVAEAFGSIRGKALFLSARASGRVEQGDATNTRLDYSARYYNQITDKRLFFTTLEGTWGNDFDLDRHVDLGGDTGLRGYPLRYQTGDSKILLSIEERYFTDWYPFRLFRVGGAIFADMGRVWGDNPAGGPPLGWLKDVGIGLRLGATRASGREVVHVDLAFPLDGDPSIDSWQFVIESKTGF